MSVMLGKLYDALKGAGATEAQASAAAEEVARYEMTRADLTLEIRTVHTGLKAEIQEVKTELKAQIQEIRAELTLHRWMFGVIVTLQLIILGKLLIP